MKDLLDSWIIAKACQYYRSKSMAGIPEDLFESAIKAINKEGPYNIEIIKDKVVISSYNQVVFRLEISEFENSRTSMIFRAFEFVWNETK